jgi:hypothetical protein
MSKHDKDDEGGPGNPGQGGGNPGPGHDPHTVTVIVNGRPKTVAKNAELSFWDVVKLAFDAPQTGDGIQYTIQFTRGPNNKPSGALVEGQTVKVKDGMEFDVTPTNRS